MRASFVWRPAAVHSISLVGPRRDADGVSKPLRVLGYVRVSTDKQDIGAPAQVRTLHDEAQRRGWKLTVVREDAASAASLAGRPVLTAAVKDLASGRYDALAVAKLDRVSRSVADFSALLVQAGRQRWSLICLDLGVDTSSTIGAAMAHVTVTFAELERRRIGERTREGMAARREQGQHLGRVSALPATTLARVHQLRIADGLTLAQVAATLATEQVPTAAGGRWHPSTVAQVLRSTAYRALY